MPLREDLAISKLLKRIAQDDRGLVGNRRRCRRLADGGNASHKNLQLDSYADTEEIVPRRQGNNECTATVPRSICNSDSWFVLDSDDRGRLRTEGSAKNDRNANDNYPCGNRNRSTNASRRRDDRM